MKLTSFLKRLITGLYTSIRRFPATLCFSTATAVMLIIINELDPTVRRETLDILKKLAMTLALGIPLSLCITHVLERRKEVKPAFGILAGAAGIAALVLYYLLLLPDFKTVSVTRYIGVSLALYVTFVLLPYFYRRENFELYVMKLFIRFWITLLYSGVLMGGIAAILFTIDKLLQIHVDEKLYLYVWYLIAGVFAPAFFLGGMPSFSQQMDKEDYSKLLRVLLLYIVMPLIAVYTVILYIYFAKAIITLEWPNGLVGHLVLWYSVISAAVIFLVSPLREVNQWVKTFIFWFIKLVLPILVIMFISIGIRINAYGITENRYFVVVLGLWVTGVMLYLNLAKHKRNIIMPITLAIIAVLSVFGPWSAYSVSRLSQNERFEHLLSNNGMLKDNMVSRAANPVAEADRNEISEILLYFSNHHSLKDIKHLPAEFKLEDMESTFGFPFSQKGYVPEAGYFTYSMGMINEPVDIQGYDYMFDFRNYYEDRSQRAGSLELKFSRQDFSLKVISNGTEIYSEKLSELAKQLHDKYKGNSFKEIQQKDMTFIIQDAAVDLKFVVYNTFGRLNESSGEISLDGMEFIVMARLK